MGIKVSSIGNSITEIGVNDLMYIAQDNGSRFNDAVISGESLLHFLGGWTNEVWLRSEQILSGYTTPVEIIPTPGDGKILIPMKVLQRTEFNGVPYDTNTNSRFFVPDAGTDWLVGTTDLAFSDSRYIYSSPSGASGAFRENKPLMWSVLNGDPLNGNSDIFIRVFYKIFEVVDNTSRL